METTETSPYRQVLNAVRAVKGSADEHELCRATGLSLLEVCANLQKLIRAGLVDRVLVARGTDLGDTHGYLCLRKGA